jgi:hypothetical protein
MTTPLFTPTPEDLAWCQTLVDMLRDGAIWGAPASGLSYRFDRTARTLTRIVGDHPVHDRNKIAFGAIGYTVLP